MRRTMRASASFLVLATAVALRPLPPVVIAPAQFGVPKDYDDLKAQLLARGHPYPRRRRNLHLGER